MNIKFSYEKGKGFVSRTDGKEKLIIKGPDSPETANSPTELLLYGMSGCSSLDIFMILGKMRKNITEFRVDMDGEREETDPKVLKKANVHYFMSGDMSEEQGIRAINLSLEKYCSVSILARRGGVDLTYSLTLNGKEVATRIKPDSSDL